MQKMILAITIRQTALIGIFAMLAMCVLLVIAAYSGIIYRALGRITPDPKRFPDAKATNKDTDS